MNRSWWYYFLAIVIVLGAGILGFIYFKGGQRLAKKINRTSEEMVAIKSVGVVCPVPKEYCQQGRVIEIKGGYYGIGYKLPVGTPIYAVFTGTGYPGGVVHSKELGGGRSPTILLKKDGGLIAAIYELSGQKQTSGLTPFQGKQIESAREGKIGNQDYNLIISVSSDKNVRLPMNVNDFYSQ